MQFEPDHRLKKLIVGQRINKHCKLSVGHSLLQRRSGGTDGEKHTYNFTLPIRSDPAATARKSSLLTFVHASQHSMPNYLGLKDEGGIARDHVVMQPTLGGGFSVSGGTC